LHQNGTGFGPLLPRPKCTEFEGHRELYDMQQASRVCAHCTTPLGESALIVRCPASTSVAYCPARFCTRLCLSRAQRTHPLVCTAQNPACAPLLAFTRKNGWLGLHALAQCTARLLLDGQSDDPRLLEDDWKVVSALAVLGMEERAKGSWCVRSFRVFGLDSRCVIGLAAQNQTARRGRRHTDSTCRRLMSPPLLRSKRSSRVW
jgi:hypothetical protein